jgi:hypothetical protein
MTRGEIMVNNNLKINLHSMVPLIASTTRVINTGKVSPKNWMRFNPRYYRGIAW